MRRLKIPSCVITADDVEAIRAAAGGVDSEIRLFHGLRKFQRHFLMFVEGRSKTFSLKYS